MLKLLNLRSLFRVCDKNVVRTPLINVEKFYSQIDSPKYSRTNDDLIDINYAQPMPLHFKGMLVQMRNAISIMLGCSKEHSREFVASHSFIHESNLQQVTDKIENLFNLGVSPQTILEYPWMLALSTSSIQIRIDILKTMKPRDINDYAPFTKASPVRLIRMVKLYKQDLEMLPQGRLYYISEKLNLDPKIVAKYVSTHLFILDKAVKIIIQNLDIMLEYKVNSMDILKDLWAFRYMPKTLRGRFERAKSSHKQKLMPWMVRCPEDILEKSLDISKTHQEIIGLDKSIADYLAERLGYDLETAKGVVLRYPPVKNIRIKKAKEMLDYLLIEEKFEQYQIARYPKILCHKTETVRQKMNILRGLGFKPLCLAVLCRSRREFAKFLNEWDFETNRQKVKEVNRS